LSTTTTYAPNAFNRLASVTLPSGSTVSYGYDAAGRQVSQASGNTTNYLWDEQSPNGDIVLETDGSSGAVQASYTLDGKGSLLAQTRGSTISYVLPDGQGSVRALANSSGAITDTYRYDAYGNLLSSTGTTVNPYRYDAQRQDATSGLYQLRARSYDPTSGRFTSRDTAGVVPSNPVELDRYNYAEDNPINLSDPSGHDAAVGTGLIEGQDATLAGGLVELGKSLMLIYVRTVLYEILSAEDAEIVFAWVVEAVNTLQDFAALLSLEHWLASFLSSSSTPPPGGNPPGNPPPGGGPGGGPGNPPNPPGGGGSGGVGGGTVTFYRGTTYYDALRAEAEGFSADILQNRQSGRSMDPGLYTSRNPDVARFFA
jgi:RHS repeat-associated protein